jgi:hypothetical protein
MASPSAPEGTDDDAAGRPAQKAADTLVVVAADACKTGDERVDIMLTDTGLSATYGALFIKEEVDYEALAEFTIGDYTSIGITLEAAKTFIAYMREKAVKVTRKRLQEKKKMKRRQQAANVTPLTAPSPCLLKRNCAVESDANIPDPAPARRASKPPPPPGPSPRQLAREHPIAADAEPSEPPRIDELLRAADSPPASICAASKPPNYRPVMAAAPGGLLAQIQARAVQLRAVVDTPDRNPPPPVQNDLTCQLLAALAKIRSNFSDSSNGEDDDDGDWDDDDRD